MSLRHVIITLLAIGLVSLLATGCQNPREGYTPEQPIPFSHYLHSGQNQVPCQYCHVSPAAGRHSTVPSVNICMNCHNLVAGKTQEGQEHIKNLRKAYAENTPVRWVKVHDLPDHAHFVHQPHIAHFLPKENDPDELQEVCAKCHGEVNTMAKVGTQVPFNMGWCVNCHRENNAPINCSTCHQ